MSKIVIIGAGHGGLAAGARLAIRGHEVQIFEPSAGPVTIEQTLTLPAAYRDLFLKTGSALEDSVELLDKDTDQNLVISNFKQAEKDQWRSYISQVGALWRDVRTKLIETHSQEPLWKIAGSVNFLKFRSFNNFVNRNLTSQKLRNLAKSYKLQAHSTSEIGLLTLNSYVQETFKVFEPKGGLSALTKALYERCVQVGVKFHFNTSARAGEADYVIINDVTNLPRPMKWTNNPSPKTKKDEFFHIPERSWLGLGPAHAVLTSEVVTSLTID